jgi:hypothetical protein
LDGPVSSLSGACPTLSFSVIGTRVYTTQSTQYRAGNCKHVEEGRRVVVVGERQPDQRVRAERIDLKQKK